MDGASALPCPCRGESIQLTPVRRLSQLGGTLKGLKGDSEQLVHRLRREGRAGDMLLLDTAPLVDFLAGTSTALRPLIEHAEATGTALAISTVTLAELFYILARFKGAGFARTCLRDMGFQLRPLPMDAAIAEQAGELKHEYAGSGKKGPPSRMRSLPRPPSKTMQSL